tara:strand:+ start:1385 stop:1927 length:543 start_codon:yes stop_codon:yes gene_type:complete
MSTLTVQNIQGSSSSSNTISVASGHQITGAAGSIIVPGQVLQLVHVNFETQVTGSGTGFTEIGLNATITPKKSTSRIFITFTPQFRLHTTNSDAGVGWGIKRDISGTEVRVYNTLLSIHEYHYNNGGWFDIRKTSTVNYVDTPNTTSATTYKAEYRRYSGTVVINQGTTNSNMTLMEIAN